MPDNLFSEQAKVLGEFIRTQRRLANLSLRDLAARTAVSNPYLSQVERGLHEPSVRVLRAIAGALDLQAETLLAYAGVDRGPEGEPADAPARTAAAIRTDPDLTEAQKSALLAVYRSYVDANQQEAAPADPTTRRR
ncbi:MAG: helix-turn-helix domain-containing protein [Acidimicrobiales bacterium]